MKTWRRLGFTALVVSLVTLFPAGAAQAQHIGGAVSAHPVMRAPMPMRPRAVGARPVAVQRRNGFNIQIPPGGTQFGNTQFGNSFENPFAFGSPGYYSVPTLLNQVPGLGFTYSDLAAFNSDLGIKAAIDPSTQWQLAVAENIAQATQGSGGAGLFLGGGGYPVPVETPAPDQQSAQPQQPQIIVIQPPAAPVAAAQAAPSAVPESAPPLPDAGPFTLVLRDGTRIHAVAFTSMGDRIIYITAQGTRKSFPESELDSAATEQINEENGTPLQLSL